LIGGKLAFNNHFDPMTNFGNIPNKLPNANISLGPLQTIENIGTAIDFGKRGRPKSHNKTNSNIS
jgi:hypothetical protein